MNVLVTEVETSETTRALQYQQLKDYSADMVAIGAMPAPPELVLSASNLPATTKAGMQKYYEEQAQAQAEANARTAQMEELKLTADIADKLGNRIQSEKDSENKAKEKTSAKSQSK